MIRASVRSLIFACFCSAAPAVLADGAGGICDADDTTLIWSDCRSDQRASLLLLPEDASVTPEGALDVTGVYTATDRRDGGRPKPVGLFIRNGSIISREYVRFDGLVVIDAAGRMTLGYRRAFDFEGVRYDLDNADQRSEFLTAVAAAGGSLGQSHLLIIDGRVDAAPVDNAPRFRRRILMQGADGTLGLYDSSPRALTLAEAAVEVSAKFAPAMALNLDMGSYDFCRRGGDLCGALSHGQTGKLSNMLRFRPAS